MVGRSGQRIKKNAFPAQFPLALVPPKKNERRPAKHRDFLFWVCYIESFGRAQNVTPPAQQNSAIRTHSKTAQRQRSAATTLHLPAYCTPPYRTRPSPPIAATNLPSIVSSALLSKDEYIFHTRQFHSITSTASLLHSMGKISSRAPVRPEMNASISMDRRNDIDVLIQWLAVRRGLPLSLLQPLVAAASYLHSDC